MLFIIMMRMRLMTPDDDEDDDAKTMRLIRRGITAIVIAIRYNSIRSS